MMYCAHRLFFLKFHLTEQKRMPLKGLCPKSISQHFHAGLNR